MAPPRTVLVDSNLLLVWVTGSVSPRLLKSFSRTTSYSEEDFTLLSDYMGRFNAVVILPNTATEVSNLLGKLKGDDGKNAANILAAAIGEWEEQYIASRDASQQIEFAWLGLTDAAILLAATDDVEVITDDAKLYSRLLERGASAVNFTHIRTRDWL